MEQCFSLATNKLQLAYQPQKAISRTTYFEFPMSSQLTLERDFTCCRTQPIFLSSCLKTEAYCSHFPLFFETRRQQLHVLLIWIVLRPSDTTVIIDPHPTSETSVSAWSLRYEYHGTVSLTHSFSSTSIVAEWMHRTLSLVCIWSHTHILVRSIS